jgi:TetR/AcrR family transcriptional regulator of autoinduction and epiphytic fitness
MKRKGRAVDPRIERSRRIVLEAALAELAAVGYGAFTIESVSSRSGVAKSTIYRHWPGKLPLIAEAFESLNQQPGAGPDSTVPDSPREKIVALIRHLADVMVDSEFSACIPALIEAAERDRQVRNFHHRYSQRRMANLVHAISEGIAKGEISSQLDPTVAALALAGPIFYRRLMTGQPYDPERVAALIDTVLGPPARKRPR